MSEMRLVMVPFYGDHIAAYQAPDGAVSAHLKWVCGAIGVAYPPQFRKVTGSDEYRWHYRTLLLDGDDRRRRCVMIGVESLPTWLLSIHFRKVAAEVGQKLRRFQLEARDALAAHFFGRRPPPVSPAPLPRALPALPPREFPAPPTTNRQRLLEDIAVALRTMNSAGPPVPHDR
jgi:P22_AR N-terminal domain